MTFFLEAFVTLFVIIDPPGIVPVFLGAATLDHGARRLWKALRHEAPGPQETAARLGVKPDGEALAQVFKTYHLPHTGKLSVTRIWRGSAPTACRGGSPRSSSGTRCRR